MAATLAQPRVDDQQASRGILLEVRAAPVRDQRELVLVVVRDGDARAGRRRGLLDRARAQSLQRGALRGRQSADTRTAQLAGTRLQLV